MVQSISAFPNSIGLHADTDSVAIVTDAGIKVCRVVVNHSHLF